MKVGVDNKQKKIVFIIILLCGLSIVIYGGYNLHMNYNFWKNGTITKGTIVDFNYERYYERRGKSGGMVSYYYPVVNFTTKDGEPYHFIDHEIENRNIVYSKMLIGKKVDVVYLFSGKEIECKIHSDKNPFLKPLGFIAMGIFMAMIGVFGYKHVKKYES